ncbi:MAG: DsbE family thiol:disulfide interchange protein [Alphaproteobacteria bacterium]
MAHKAALMPLACFAVLAGVFAMALLREHNPAILPSALIGKPAPALELPAALKGSKGLTPEALTGGITAVNIFASWCVTCVGEQPTLMQMKKDGVTVLGIAYKDSRENIALWLQKHGNPFSAVGLDEKGRAAIDWGVYGVPETYFIDAEGIVRHKHIGALSMQDYTAKLKPLLEEMRK